MTKPPTNFTYSESSDRELSESIKYIAPVIIYTGHFPTCVRKTSKKNYFSDIQSHMLREMIPEVVEIMIYSESPVRKLFINVKFSASAIISSRVIALIPGNFRRFLHFPSLIRYSLGNDT